LKKILLPIFTLLLLAGCEKKFNNPVDVTTSQFQVLSTSNFQFYRYNTDSPSIIVFLKVDNSQDVSQVSAHIFDPDGNELDGSPIKLFDDGKISVSGDTTANDGEYTNKFKMSASDPVGQYGIKFYVQGTDGEVKLAAIQYFNYDNGQTNQPPVISNVNAPDTLVVTHATNITMTVNVSDPNGLSDIQNVYFISYKPDGTTNNTQYSLYDDGNTSSDGDVKANDGIYSIIIQIAPSNTKGIYRFDFHAVDKSNAVSNIISQNIVVK
jgi:hypothetical protein